MTGIGISSGLTLSIGEDRLLRYGLYRQYNARMIPIVQGIVSPVVADWYQVEAADMYWVRVLFGDDKGHLYQAVGKLQEYGVMWHTVEERVYN